MCISTAHCILCLSIHGIQNFAVLTCVFEWHIILRGRTQLNLSIYYLCHKKLPSEDKRSRVIIKYDKVVIKIKVLSDESFSGNYGLGFELKMKGELVSQTIISSLHILVDLVNILNILHV